LSFDSTVVTRYGQQEGARKGYNPKKKGRKSHHPIFAFLNRSQYVVKNRSGDSASGNGIVDFCKQTIVFPEGDAKVFNYKYGIYISSSDSAPETLWREYRLRINDENIIKENQDFGLEGFSQNSFYATAMLIRILFYNIINLFRNKILPEQESKLRMQTLRSRYFHHSGSFGARWQESHLEAWPEEAKCEAEIPRYSEEDNDIL
jgi:hypothetical protein